MTPSDPANEAPDPALEKLLEKLRRRAGRLEGRPELPASPASAEKLADPHRREGED